MTCRITIQSTSSDKMCTNISATAKEHAAIVPSLLAMHCLSGCDTVGPMYGIRKRKTSKVLRSGYSWKWGFTDAPILDVISEATKFMAACFGSKKGYVRCSNLDLGQNNVRTPCDVSTRAEIFTSNSRRLQWKCEKGHISKLLFGCQPCHPILQIWTLSSLDGQKMWYPGYWYQLQHQKMFHLHHHLF